MQRAAPPSDDVETWRQRNNSDIREKRYNFTEFRVLLLHENAFMQRLIADVLRGFGCTSVFTARDTDVAWAEVTGRAFDFLLVDWMVAPLDGGTFLRNIRQSGNRELEVVPVIMVTGHSEQFRVEAARDAGVNEFLTLPLAPVTLFDRIVSLIERPRPYIRTRSFFGPDRRRRRDVVHPGPFLRATDPDDLRHRAAPPPVNTPVDPPPEAEAEPVPESSEKEVP